MSALAEDPTVAMTRAPCRRAIWTAALPTPLPAACTRTSSPRRTPARATSMCQAVRKTRGNAAPSSNDSDAGSGRTLAAGSATNSACVPFWCSPIRRYSLQSGSWPERQASQRPHDVPGDTKIRSPGATPATPAPTSATIPEASHPGIIGSGSVTPGIPRRTQVSRWFIPAAFTWITTCPASALGRGKSAISRTSGPPCLRIRTAFTRPRSASSAARCTRRLHEACRTSAGHWPLNFGVRLST